MDPIWITAIGGTAGLLLATCGFVWGMYTWIQQSHRNRVNLHMERLCGLYQKTRVSILLSCHGISDAEFDLAEFYEEELRYLLINFTISRMYQHSRTPLQEGPFRKNSYRYNLCRSDTTRRAFEILKRIFGDVEITRRIDATLREIATTTSQQAKPREKVQPTSSSDSAT